MTAGGNPVGGKTVTVGQATGSSTITVVNGVSNASGQASFKTAKSTGRWGNSTGTDTEAEDEHYNNKGQVNPKRKHTTIEAKNVTKG